MAPNGEASECSKLLPHLFALALPFRNALRISCNLNDDDETEVAGWIISMSESPPGSDLIRTAAGEGEEIPISSASVCLRECVWCLSENAKPRPKKEKKDTVGIFRDCIAFNISEFFEQPFQHKGHRFYIKFWANNRKFDMATFNNVWISVVKHQHSVA